VRILGECNIPWFAFEVEGDGDTGLGKAIQVEGKRKEK
jgi:hypothetical protein